MLTVSNGYCLFGRDKTTTLAPNPMIEPETPVTIRVRHLAFPAFLLSGDDDVKFKPSSAFMRYRHLRQHQRVLKNFLFEPVSGHRASLRKTPGVPVDLEKEHIEQLDLQEGTSTQPQVTHDGVRSEVQPEERPISESSLRSEVEANNVSTSSSSATATDTESARSQHTEQHSPSSARPDTSSPVVRRFSHGIYKSSEKTVWYASTGRDPLDAPLPIPQPRFGDLYVHHVSDGAVQVWLRTSAQTWLSIDMFHPHPFLEDYVVNILPNREPRWVKKDTIRTYRGRAKKRVRDGSHTPSSE